MSGTAPESQGIGVEAVGGVQPSVHGEISPAQAPYTSHLHTKHSHISAGTYVSSFLGQSGRVFKQSVLMMLKRCTRMCVGGKEG